jgi:hypothetical protein
MGFIAAPVLFVLSCALLYSARHQRNGLLFFLALLIAIVSSVFLTAQLIRFTSHTHGRYAVSQIAEQAVPQAREAATPAPSLGEQITQSAYQIVETALDWIVRTGTGNSSAAVSSDTVVGAIGAILLSLLAFVGSLLSAVVRRLIGLPAVASG